MGVKKNLDESDKAILKKLGLYEDDESDSEEIIVFRGSAADFAKKFGFKLPATDETEDETEDNGAEDEGENESKKSEPKPKSRSRYFGG